VAIRCLLVEDDSEIRLLLDDYLRRFGMTVTLAPDAAAMRHQLRANQFEVILLDLMLPDGNGMDLCREIRQSRPTPIIMLTAQGDPVSRVVGLELGADDYVPKPFEPRELVARIHAVLRRFNGPTVSVQDSLPPVVTFSGWRFDRLNRHIVSSAGLTVQLSGAEFRLLDALVTNPEVVLCREQLVLMLQTPGVEVSGRSVDLTVSRLRQKLQRGIVGPELIRTVRGEGYLFAATVNQA
jgi:two-component system OmpR family response regulator